MGKKYFKDIIKLIVRLLVWLKISGNHKLKCHRMLNTIKPEFLTQNTLQPSDNLE